jgi:hypothetical protein
MKSAIAAKGHGRKTLESSIALRPLDRQRAIAATISSVGL